MKSVLISLLCLVWKSWSVSLLWSKIYLFYEHGLEILIATTCVNFINRIKMEVWKVPEFNGIVLILPGHCRYGADMARQLADALQKVLSSCGSIRVSFSRRTPEKVWKIFSWTLNFKTLQKGDPECVVKMLMLFCVLISNRCQTSYYRSSLITLRSLFGTVKVNNYHLSCCALIFSPPYLVVLPWMCIHSLSRMQQSPKNLFLYLSSSPGGCL